VDYVWVSNFYGVEIDRTVDFQLSQRADHIVKTISSRVRFNRAIINPKWDSYYSYADLHRLHVLFGEANMSDYALMLKVGTTSLALELIEDGWPPRGVEMTDPLGALRQVSRDPTWRWLVRLRDGRTISAVDLQRLYLKEAARRYGGRDTQTDWVLSEWNRTLDDLERDPMSTANRLDWTAKRKLYLQFMEQNGAGWHDDILQSLDLEYHNVNREVGLSAGLEDAGDLERLVTGERVDQAVVAPPENTRAFARGQIVRTLLERNSARYVVDWDAIYLDRNRQLELRNPLHTYEKESSRFLRGTTG
jgi:proteasome accessory factor A